MIQPPCGSAKREVGDPHPLQVSYFQAAHTYDSPCDGVRSLPPIFDTVSQGEATGFQTCMVSLTSP